MKLGCFFFFKLIFLIFCFINVSYAKSEPLDEKITCLKAVQRLDYDIAIQQCEYEMEKGDMYAAEILGIVYLTGRSGVRDWDLARRSFEQAIEMGNIHANGFLGEIYWHGWGVRKNRQKAEEFFAKCLLEVESDIYDVDISCRAIYAQTLGNYKNKRSDKEKALEEYTKLMLNSEFIYAYDFAKISYSLGKYEDAYAYAEFFMLWAKRYGVIWNLQSKYKSAEEISAKAVNHLSQSKVDIISLDVKHSLYALNKKNNYQTNEITEDLDESNLDVEILERKFIKQYR